MKSALTIANNVALAPVTLPMRTDASIDSKTQPFPYQGSKRILASTIFSLIGGCGRVVEPFAGSATVSIAVRATVSLGLVADINAPHMELWRRILATPGVPSQTHILKLWVA